jgi:type I restriction-modification system DNA methylase subunit
MPTTYTPDILRKLFQSSFNLTQWYTFLQYFFNATELKEEPERIIGSTSDNGYYLGNIDTTDSYRIGLFHYNITKGSVANRRVGLRNLVKSFINPTWGEFDAALVVFDSGDHWRLSFICDIKGEATSPKRYTYVFGSDDLLYRTPIERFYFLKKKGISFENLRTAFSVEALSDEFFDKYREQYADFIQYVTGKRFVKVGSKWEEKVLGEPNAALTQAFDHNEKKIRDYVKKMMGRITFLHFLQRKGWMCGDLNYMQNLFENSAYKDDYLDSVLEPLFFGILNTKPAEREALFTDYSWDKSLLNEWKDIPYLNGGLFERDEEDEPESRFPADYFKRLFQFFSEYNFTIDENDPNDAEVGVDPEMLGKIFENLLEDNKDKGAFYTPKEIVRYMCQESLIAYLETNTSIAKDKIRNFVLTPEDGVDDIPENKKPKLLTALEEVKICDPAIGSGAFPMGLLNELLHCREVLSGEHYDRAEIKKNIIQNNIYGVDIEKGAVDIARLRFWLSIVVDEETPSLLPNLDYKIMQGNSLIESFMGVDLSKLTYEKEYKKDKGEISLFDDEKNRLQKTVSHLLSSYYSCSDHDRKVKLQQEISGTINKQLEAQAYDPTILARLKDINLAENNKFFLWHTWFSDVFNRDDDKNGFDIVIGNPPYVVVSDIDKDHLYYKYKTKNCLELYAYFFEHSINILHQTGVLSFITGSLYTKGIKFEPLRIFLEKNSQLITYRNEGDEVFKNVNMPTSTILLYKSNFSRWSFDDLLGNSNNILAKMNTYSKPLSSISIMQRGFEVGRDRVSKEHGKYRFLTGSNVEKYCYKTISYVNQDVVDEFQKDAIFYTGERLLIRETGSYLTVVYLDENLYCNRSLYSTIIKDSQFNVQYVVGILNSKAIQYYYQQKFKAETELFPKIRIKQAKQLPIPVASLTEQQLIVTLIEKIITAKRISPQISIEKLEREIDQIVYKLYDLTDTEIKIIEQSI